MPEIVLKNVSYSYRKDRNSQIKVFENLNVTFPSSSISVILGPSGSGKSTLLRLIAGLETTYGGEIFFDDFDMKDVHPSERSLSYVTQNFSMYPHMTIFDSIAYPLKLVGAGRDEIKARVFDISEKLGITDILSRKPKQISIGEIQRACIARALVKRPDVCLFDEPLSNVDGKARDEIRLLLKNSLRAIGSTVIYVTHSLNEATSIGDGIYFLEEGRFVHQCKPRDVIKTDNKIIKDYLESNDD